MNKKTKIVCTIGPATESPEMLQKLLHAGMNVMRLNFSHGDFAEHQNRVNNLRTVMKKTGMAAAILQDLSGPKIRIGEFSTDFVTLKEGATFTLTTEKIIGDEKKVYVNYPLLPKEVKKGDTIFLHDGKKKLVVTNIKGNEIITKVIVGGDIKARRGVNLPDSDLSVSALTDKDKKDIEFGIKNDVDFFALSFVRTPEDIKELRAILKAKKSTAKIIAKIETPQALKVIDAIIAETDGVMVARGDLAIEIPAENVPLAQKMIIKKCNDAAKPVITATQMLESMIKSATPTRAEISDIANAIIDGTDAVMLSEETTLGEFPVHAVEVMAKVANTVENSITYIERFKDAKKLRMDLSSPRLVDAVTSEVVDLANTLDAKAIVALTNTGRTALTISRYKPARPIFAFTPNKHTFNQLQASFGVTAILIPKINTLNEVLPLVRMHLLKNKTAVKGDSVVIAAGTPFSKSIDVNTILVETL